MSTEARLSDHRKARYLIPKFPEHLTFYISLPSRNSTRKIPYHKSIYAAAQAGDVIDVSLFINEGVDVNAVDSIGDAPIHYACISKHRNQHIVLRMLLVNGANPLALTVTGQTVLHLLAVHSKSPSTLLSLRHLVGYGGIDINMCDEIKRTPLQYLLGIHNSISTVRLEDIVKFFILNGATIYNTDLSVRYTYIIECLMLIDGIVNEGDEFTENVSLITSIQKLSLIITSYDQSRNLFELENIIGRIIVEAKTFYCNELFSWGPGECCSISKWEFLSMSEKRIADLAIEEPLLYFAIKQPFRAFKLRYAHSFIKRWKILSQQYQAQFNIFCYYFVKEQLKALNFTAGGVSLNYDCVQTLASFMDLKDLVNLCEAFNFKDTIIEGMRQLNRRN